MVVVVAGESVVGGAVLVVGAGLNITSEVGTVVAGAARVTVVVGATGRAVVGGAGTVVETTTVGLVVVVVVVVVESSTVGGTVAPGPPSTRVEAVGKPPRVRRGWEALARGVLAASRAVAAMMSRTKTAPTPTTSMALARLLVILADHQSRSRSCAGVRP